MKQTRRFQRMARIACWISSYSWWLLIPCMVLSSVFLEKSRGTALILIGVSFVLLTLILLCADRRYRVGLEYIAQQEVRMDCALWLTPGFLPQLPAEYIKQVEVVLMRDGFSVFSAYGLPKEIRCMRRRCQVVFLVEKEELTQEAYESLKKAMRKACRSIFQKKSEYLYIVAAHRVAPAVAAEAYLEGTMGSGTVGYASIYESASKRIYTHTSRRYPRRAGRGIRRVMARAAWGYANGFVPDCAFCPEEAMWQKEARQRLEEFRLRGFMDWAAREQETVSQAFAQMEEGQCLLSPALGRVYCRFRKKGYYFHCRFYEAEKEAELWFHGNSWCYPACAQKIPVPKGTRAKLIRQAKEELEKAGYELCFLEK